MATDQRGEVSQVLPIGTRVGDFEIVGLVGVGGFGIVYEAEDPVLQRRVALKEYMPASMAARVGQLQVAMLSESARETFETGRRSFINEARLLARFDHPSLVKVYRFWEANGTAYMVMPLYRGPTLRQAILDGRTPVDEAWLLRLLGPLLEALDHLHRADCFHRDIAPDNILLLDDGLPLLLDFGAARRVIGDATQDMTVILKPGFAPIEQYGAGVEARQGPWTDLYALACVVYFCATGRVPVASVSRILSDTLPPLAVASGGRLSAPFCAAIDQAMRLRIEERIRSVEALRLALGLGSPAPSTLFVPSVGATQPTPGEPFEVVRTDLLAPTVMVDPGPAATRQAVADHADLGQGPAPAMGATELLGAAPSNAGMGGAAGVRGRHPAGQVSARPGGDPGRRPFNWRVWLLIVSIPGALALAVGWIVLQSRAPTSVAGRPTPGAPPVMATPGSATDPGRGAGVSRDVDPPGEPGAAALSDGSMAADRPALPDRPIVPDPVSAQDSSGPASSYSARAAIESVAQLADPAIDVQVRLARRRLRINQDPLSFTVRSPQGGYLYLLMAGTRDNDLYLLFPNAQEADNRLAANTERTLPGRGWEMIFEGPPGIDHFVILVSARPRHFPEAGVQPIGLFREFVPDIAAAQFTARRGAAFVGEAVNCSNGDAACQRFGAARFDIEEVD